MGKSESHHQTPAIVFVGTVDKPSTVAATLAEKGSEDPLLTTPNSEPIVQYVHELPLADEERLEKLFKKLDRDANGRIDIHDLSEALREVGMCHTYAKVILFFLSKR